MTSDTSGDSPSDMDLFVRAVERSQDLIESGRCADAEEAIEEVFGLVMKLAERDESPDWQLVVEASDREAVLDYSGVEAANLKRLALPDCDEHAWGAHRDLASLYVVLNRHDEAIHHAQQATSAARKLNVPIATAMALRSEGVTYLRVDRVSAAERCFAEAIGVLDAYDPAYRQMRASLLTQLANCAVHGEKCDSATEYLETADVLLRPLQPMLSAAGIQSDLANWWATTARLRLLLRENDDAVAAWQEAISRARHVAELPQCEGLYTRLNVATMLHHFGQSLTKIGQDNAAQQALAESRQIVGDLALPQQQYYDA
jgi:tetratricopeptide (TPR) repeat protein